jgi:hypothetical protein
VSDLERLRTEAADLMDSRRVAACVHACFGVPTEALESGALGKALEALQILAVEHDPHDCGTAVSVGTSALRALGRLP